jgi:hypothetical protein
VGSNNDITVIHGTSRISEAEMSFFFWSEISSTMKQQGMTTHPFSNGAKSTFNLLQQAGILNKGAIRYDRLQVYLKVF